MITALAFLLLAGNAAPENVSGSCRQDTTAVDADFLRKVRAARDVGIDTLAEVRTEIAEFASALAARPDSASVVESFRNGLLVYEITRMMVDEPSRGDTAALNRYFLSHRDEFRWERPRFKGYVLAAVSDSVADIALEWLASLLGSIAVLVWRRLRLSPCLKLAGANPSFWDRPPTFRTKFTHILFSFLFCLYQYKFSHPKFVWTHSPFSFAK